MCLWFIQLKTGEEQWFKLSSILHNCIATWDFATNQSSQSTSSALSRNFTVFRHSAIVVQTKSTLAWLVIWIANQRAMRHPHHKDLEINSHKSHLIRGAVMKERAAFLPPWWFSMHSSSDLFWWSRITKSTYILSGMLDSDSDYLYVKFSIVGRFNTFLLFHRFFLGWRIPPPKWPPNWSDQWMNRSSMPVACLSDRCIFQGGANLVLSHSVLLRNDKKKSTLYCWIREHELKEDRILSEVDQPCPAMSWNFVSKEMSFQLRQQYAIGYQIPIKMVPATVTKPTKKAVLTLIFPRAPLHSSLSLQQ